MSPIFFAKQSDFRKWLEKNHLKEKELLVGFYKVGSNKPSITWPQSVDEALCFGWIDGVRKSIDAESYTIRFTPRRHTSIWSAVNIKKVAELTAQGLMKPEGLAIFAKRKESKSKIYSHEKEATTFTPAFENQFKANKKAWAFFTSQAPGYQKILTHWVMDAKQETTRIKRVHILISSCEAGKKLR